MGRTKEKLCFRWLLTWSTLYGTQGWMIVDSTKHKRPQNKKRPMQRRAIFLVVSTLAYALWNKGTQE